MKASRKAHGFGLYLQTAKGGTRSWVYIWRDQSHRTDKGNRGKLREFGLGSFGIVTKEMALAEALRIRREQHINPAYNPVAEKRIATVAAVRSTKTFNEVMLLVLEKRAKEKKIEGGIEAEFARKWRNSLAKHAEALLKMRVCDVTDDVVVNLLRPIWFTISKTAQDNADRIRLVMDYAIAEGLHKGPNPARKDMLDARVGERENKTDDEKIEDAHAALSLPRAQWALSELLQQTHRPALALAFLMLTGVRSSEAREAQWSEIDWANSAWIIPAKRMKRKARHEVPLSSDALAILKRLHNVTGGSKYVFASEHVDDQAISPPSLLSKMRNSPKSGGLGIKEDEANVHGLRSTFSQWCRDTGQNVEAREISLAHKVGNDVGLVYARSSMFVMRQKLMQDYADVLMGRAALPAQAPTLQVAA